MSRSTALLAAIALVWALLLVFQSTAGPVDGYVPAHVGRDGASVGLGPSLHGWFAQPLLNALGSIGVHAVYAALIFVLALLAALVQGTDVPRAVALVLAALIGLTALVNLPYLSNDLYLYGVMGEMQAHGIHPYENAPLQNYPPGALERIPWTSQTAAYGPLALNLFHLPASLAQDYSTRFWLLKSLLALPWLAALAIAARRSNRALAWIALSPLLWFEVLQSGHLEGWIGLALMVAVFAAQRGGRPGAMLVGASLALAVCMKLSAVVVLGAFGVHAYRRRDGTLPYVAVAFVLVAAALYIPHWKGAATFEGARVESLKVLRSIPALIAQTTGMSAQATRSLAAIGSVVALLTGSIVRWRGSSLATACVATLLVQAFLGRTFFQPWYLATAWMLVTPDLFGARDESWYMNPRLWSVLGVSALVGGYGVFLLSRSVSPGYQALSIAIILLPAAASLRWWHRT